MRKENNPNYNTTQSDVKAFSDFVPDEEKKDLKQYNRSYLKNTDSGTNLPNRKRLRYNKVTKTWQAVSKKEVNDKLKSLEKIKIKSFEDIINENDYAFGEKQYTSETFFTDLEKDIYTHKGQLNQIKDSVEASDPYLTTILDELGVHFTEMIQLVRSRHDNFLNKNNNLDSRIEQGKPNPMNPHSYTT